jgi:hypothetical protein
MDMKICFAMLIVNIYRIQVFVNTLERSRVRIRQSCYGRRFVVDFVITLILRTIYLLFGIVAKRTVV